MKKLTNIFMTTLFAMGIVFSLNSASMAQTPEAKIILVDFQRVTTESLVGLDVQAQLEQNRVAIETRANELSTNLQTEQQELERQRSIIAPDAFEERVRGFNQRQNDARAEIQNRQQDQQRAVQQATLEIQRRVRPIILEIMENRGATMVIDKLGIYHSVGGLDVTTDVIDGLNAVLSAYKITLAAN